MAPDTVPDTTSILWAIATFIPLVVWLMTTVHWMFMGEVDVLTGFVAIVAGFAMGVMALTPPVPILSPIFCGVVWLTVLFFPIVRSAWDKRALASIDLDSLDKAYVGLQTKPDNVGLKIKIAKLLYSRGLTGHAIVLAEEALKGMPEQIFHEELKMISQWRLSAGDPQTVRSLPCLECGNLNTPGRLHCQKCGAPFLLHHAKGKWMGPNLARRVIAIWTAGIAMLAGVPMALTYLVAWQAVIALVALAAASFAIVVRAFHSGKEAPG